MDWSLHPGGMPECCDSSGVDGRFGTAIRGCRSRLRSATARQVARPPATFWQASGLLSSRREDERAASSGRRDGLLLAYRMSSARRAPPPSLGGRQGYRVMSGEFKAETQGARRAAEARRGRSFCSAFLCGLRVSALNSRRWACPGRPPGLAQPPTPTLEPTAAAPSVIGERGQTRVRPMIADSALGGLGLFKPAERRRHETVQARRKRGSLPFSSPLPPLSAPGCNRQQHRATKTKAMLLSCLPPLEGIN